MERERHPRYEYNRAYRERNRERIRATNKKHWESNLEENRRRSREYMRAHPEARTRAIQRFKENNPERFWAKEQAHTLNRRAKRLGYPGRVGTQDVVGLMERTPKCVSCGHGRGVDHIVELALGGTNTADNLQNLCTVCNGRKSHRALRAVMAAIIEHHGRIPLPDEELRRICLAA